MRASTLRPSFRRAAVDVTAGPARVSAALLAVAAAGWWWSARMADSMGGGAMDGAMSMSFGAFVVAWVAMMAAMMLPAVLPVVRLYGRAAARGRTAPMPYFAGGYLLLWTLPAIPAWFAFGALDAPVDEGAAWAGRVAGGTLLLAAAWQLTPMKAACLRHCRSPLGFFMRRSGGTDRPLGALRMGLEHAGFCVGCCWALFAMLVALGTMDLGWMIAVTALVLLEKQAPMGEEVARAAAVAIAVLGVVLLASPSTITDITWG